MEELFREVNLKFYKRYSKLDDSKEFWELMKAPLRQSIRINTLKAPFDYIVKRLKERYELEPIPWVKEGFFINTREFSTMIEHALGLVFPQEASSMIPPVVLDPKPGELILDMAAAPGAKTTQIAQYMENEGCLVANDMKKWRVNILRSNLNRFGVLNALVTQKDGTYFGRFKETFDKILLDAPCTSVGMVRKSFKFAKDWKIDRVYMYSKIQKKLILAAYKALKPGGTLVYSTCTVDPFENEEVVDFLLMKTDAKLEKIKLPLKSTPPILEFDGHKYSEEVKKCLRLHPQDNNTEAFFVAKIRKP
ncbi:tRNA methyltransferase [Palaeococcus pacificus DY20341]|uniref:tRNA methyltransferase n=1 Tax=Palaeococcus pacificus DY20341 TaxID=1343739 RepID=A0A075LRL7_9EURY|nr:tRNA (cytosine(49)-C(5))-methyltransferase [Palaeococcus pacificus]AIF68979.1 tRNA methyltransferase [Palaeococcus pacificus DY20341]